jgi:hypothetical protein
MADEVNQKAFDGGDTEPGTAAVIKARNEALQGYNDKLRDVGQQIQAATDEGYQAGLEAEQATADDNFDLITGAPVVTPPENIGAGQTKGASSPAQSQSRKKS